MTGSQQDALVALVLGLVLGAGLWAIVASLPRWAAPTLMQRVAPYVRDVTDAAGTSLPHDVPTDPGAAIVALARTIRDRTRSGFGALLGGADATRSRLAAAAWRLTAEEYRGRQLAATVVAAGIGALGSLALSVSGQSNSAVWFLPLVCGALGFVACDLLLTRAVAARRARIHDELPTVLEFLALCLSAGEGLADSVRRASEVGSGALSGELRRVVLDVGTGAPLGEALADLATRVDVPGVRRAVEHLVAAIDRGAPLAAVLRDQSADAREQLKREMLEQAGRKEVAMLLPLVFLILPLSVLIAVFPGLQLIRLG